MEENVSFSNFQAMRLLKSLRSSAVFSKEEVNDLLLGRIVFGKLLRFDISSAFPLLPIGYNLILIRLVFLVHTTTSQFSFYLKLSDVQPSRHFPIFVTFVYAAGLSARNIEDIIFRFNKKKLDKKKTLWSLNPPRLNMNLSGLQLFFQFKI